MDVLGPLLEADAANPSHQTIQAVSDAVTDPANKGGELLRDKRLTKWIAENRHRINEWSRTKHVT